MSNVYLFLANGFEMIEALTVVDILRRAKIEIATVSINADKKVLSSHKVTIEADYTFEELDYSDASMFVLPGGVPGTPNLAKHKGLTKLLDQAYSDKKWLAAICAAPSVFGERNYLVGKEATCYPGFEQNLKDSIVLNQAVVKADHIITGRGMGVAIEFSLALVKVLKSENDAANIAESIQYSQYLERK